MAYDFDAAMTEALMLDPKERKTARVWAGEEAVKTFDDDMIDGWLACSGKHLTLIWIDAMISRLRELRKKIGDG